MIRYAFRTILLAVLLAGLAVSARAEIVPWQDAEALRSESAQVLRRLFRQPDASLRQDLAVRTARVKALWNGPLGSVYRQAAPEQAAKVSQAMRDLDAAVAHWDPVGASAARALLWTGLVDGAFRATLASLDGGRAEEAAAWLNIRDYARASRDTAATVAMSDLVAGRLDAARARTIIEAELLGVYAGELRQAIADMRSQLAAGHDVQFAAARSQAIGLAALLSSNMETRLGVDRFQAVSAAFSDLATTLPADRRTLDDALVRIEQVLANYAPVSLSAEERDRRVRLLVRFVALIPVEYEKAVRDGEVTIPLEYFEAGLFRDRAEMLLGDLGQDLAARSPEALERLVGILSEMKAVIVHKSDEAQVRSLAEEARTLLGTVYAAALAAGSYESALSRLPDVLGEILAATRMGDWEAAELKRLEAYALFDPDIEQRLMPRSPSLAVRMEADFWEGTVDEPGLGRLIAGHGRDDALTATVTRMQAATAEAGTMLRTKLSFFGALLQSLAILLREGLEAVLVLACMIGALKATGTPAAGMRGWRWPLATGVGMAMAGSFALWLLVGKLFEMTTLQREFLEGATALAAAAVLVYVTHWIFHKAYSGAWVADIRRRTTLATADPTRHRARQLTLLGLAFMVVFREGFETALFYEALLADAPAVAVLAGLGLGAALAAAAAYGMLRLEAKLPVSAFFRVTGAVLFVLCVIMVGSGIRGLQTAALVPATPVAWFPDLPWLQIYLGLYPVAESLLAQAAVASLLVVSGLWPLAHRRWSMNPI